MIHVGDKIPTAELLEGSPSQKVTTTDLFAGKRIILFGVIGAFTSGCSKVHLAGYVADAEAIRAKGVDEVFCVSVNDAAVMTAWGEAQGAHGKVRLLADPQGLFTKATGLDVHVPHLGGLRSKRYAMLIEDNEVKEMEVEPDGFGLSCSLSSAIIDRI